jgi:hypothetical protein
MLEKQTPYSTCIASEDRKLQLKVLKCNSDFLLSLRNDLEFNQRSLIPRCSFLFHPDNLGKLYPEHKLIQHTDEKGEIFFEIKGDHIRKAPIDKVIDHTTIGLATNVADGLHNIRGLFVGQGNLKKKEDSELYKFIIKSGNEARVKMKRGLLGFFKPGLVKMGLENSTEYYFDSIDGGKLKKYETPPQLREYT